MRATRLAAAAILLLAAYLQLVEWVDLFPWNDVRQGNGQETLDLILAAASAALVAWLWVGGRVAAGVAAAALAVWAWLQITTWWLPYFTGASESWRRVYARWFSETISVLPRTQDRLPPDANHLVLQLLIFMALAMCLRALAAGPRARG